MKLDLARLHVLDSDESELSDKNSCPPQSLGVLNVTEKTRKKRHKSANEVTKTMNVKKQRKSADKPISSNPAEKTSEIKAKDPLVEQAMQILQKRRALVKSTDIAAAPASPLTAQNDIVGTTYRLSPSLTQLTTTLGTACTESRAFQSEEPIINEFGYLPAGPASSTLARNINMCTENDPTSVENSTAPDWNTTAPARDTTVSAINSGTPVWNILKPEYTATLHTPTSWSNPTPVRNNSLTPDSYNFPDETLITPAENTPTSADISTFSTLNDPTLADISTTPAWNTQTPFRISTTPAQTTSTPARITALTAWSTHTPAMHTPPPSESSNTPACKTQTPKNVFMSLLDSSLENEQVSDGCHSCSLLIRRLESRVADLEAQVKAMQNQGAGSLATTPAQTPRMPRVLQFSSNIQQKENIKDGTSTEAIVADIIRYESRMPKALSKAMRTIFTQEQLATCSFKGGITCKGAPRPGLPEVERDIIIDTMARHFAVDTSTVEGKMRSALNRFCKAYSGLSPL